MRKNLSVALVFMFVIFKAQVLNYYFGNIHSHTGFSDGNQDSLSSGISGPSGSYAFAKLSQNFNFLGISEHNHYSADNNPGFQIQSWPIGMSQASSANQEGSFLCLFGMEWGVTSSYHGHVLIYGFPQLIGWENSPINYDVYNAKQDYDALFRKVKNLPGSFLTLAHPQTNDYSTDGTVANSLINAPYNSAYDSAITGTPLKSGYYLTAASNYTDYAIGNYFDYYKILLAKGYHLGMTYDHDNHNTTFGRNNAGRLVIITPSLTIANFYSAMQNMHFYGSDDWNAKVAFTMNGNIMGSVLSGTANPVFHLTHNDSDGELADSIKIWKGISNDASLPEVANITLQSNSSSYTDNNLQPGLEYYYFAEIKQTDGQWIVTSPIWYKNTLTAGIKENTGVLDFNYFPNPVSQKLSVSTSETNHYQISILDLTGRIIFEKSFYDKSFLIDLSGFSAGIYYLKFGNFKSSVTKKLVIE